MLSDLTDKNFFTRFKAILLFLSMGLNVCLLTYLLLAYKEELPCASPVPPSFPQDSPTPPPCAPTAAPATCPPCATCQPTPDRPPDKPAEKTPPTTMPTGEPTKEAPNEPPSIRNKIPNTWNEFKSINDIVPSAYPEITIVLNADRTKTFQIVHPPLLDDILSIACITWGLNEECITQPQNLKLWYQRAIGQTMVEITSNDYKGGIVMNKNIKKMWFTYKPDEQLRTLNGIWATLMTPDKIAGLDYWYPRWLNVTHIRRLKKFQDYPLMIFHTLNQTQIDKIKTKANFTDDLLQVYWVNVSRYFIEHRLPDYQYFHETNTTVENFAKKNFTDCYKVSWTFPYMSMNRWRNLIMWRIPILRYFDYTTWLDADALLFAQGIDIFMQLHDAGAYLGYKQFDCCDCGKNIEQGFADYMGNFSVKPIWHRAESDSYVYSNFVVFNNSFFSTSKEMFHFFDYMDAVNGGVWKYRWFDQVLFPAGMSLFCDFDKMMYIKRTRYVHYGSEGQYARAILKNGRTHHERVSWPEKDRLYIREGIYPLESSIRDSGNPE